MRTKRALFNMITSLLLQAVTVVCGFILPRLFLSRFGSEVNGAVASISQFLGYISLLEAGVGGVTRAALYRPLANADTAKISGIIKATEKFFHKLSGIFIAYTVVLSVVFKSLSHTELSWLFIATLVWILSLGQFAQYYFGISYSILLIADQRSYVSYLVQIATVILNALLSVLMIELGFSVHAVKLISISVYVLRPIVLNRIVKKQYSILKDAKPDDEAISQRWNGFGHHVAFFIHNNVDIMVITSMLGLKAASVYSVYYMIVGGVKNIVNAMTGVGEATFGSMIAKNENDLLNRRFHMVETLTSMIVVAVFTTTGILLLDFISIYTHGILDVNYIIPTVGVLFILSEACHCFKQIYNSVVLAAGHYKETQVGAFIEAGLNLLLSILLAFHFKLAGVLFATIIATTYRTFDYLVHLKNNILKRPLYVFFCRQTLNIINALIIIGICYVIPFSRPETYLSWVMKAIPVFSISILVTLILNLVFYRSDLLDILLLLRNTIKNK